MKRIALILALAATAHAGGPPKPYYPAPHIVWDGTGGFQSTFQPTILAASLVSASGLGNDWAAMTGTGGGAQVSPNAYAGLLVCTSNCSDSLRAQWQPWSGSGGGTPASPVNSVQYNSDGSFGAVPLNTTATRQFLLQTSSGAPSFSTLASGDIPNNAANTTGNAATATIASNVGNASSTLNGIRKATAGAADSAASSADIVGVANTSPSTKLSSQLLPNGLISVAQVGTLWGDWDSYGYGTGPANPARFAPFQLVSSDVPAPFVNLSRNGAIINEISGFAFGQYQPNQLGLPDVALYGAGENDTGCASTTAACGYSFKEMRFGALMHWLNPPSFSNSIWASASTKTGTWNTETGIYGTFNKIAAGTPITSTASGGTLTFSIPSSTASKVYITYVARVANTGSFTATIDGTPLTDEFSATTQFSGAPLATNPTITQGYAIYTQGFSVTPGTSHTLVITATGIVEISRVNTNKLGASDPANMVYDYNVIPILGAYTIWNPIIAALDASIRADGFLLGAVDLVNGTSTSSTQWSSINPTSFPQAGAPYTGLDFNTSPTALCTATLASSHPNDCGGMDFYRNFLNAQANLGVIISRVSLGAKYAEQTGNFYVSPTLTPIKTNSTLKDFSYKGVSVAGFEVYSGTNFYAGTIEINDGTSGNPWSGKLLTGPVWSSTNFWYCGSQINGYSDTNAYPGGSVATKWCDDPTGIAYRTQLITTGAAPNASTSGAVVASAATIAITSPIFHISGVAAINTMTFPTGFDGTHGGCVDVIADGAWQTTTAGNFFAVMTAVPGTPYRFCAPNTADKWYGK